MSNAEKLRSMIENDEAFRRKLSTLKSKEEVASKIGDYAKAHGIDFEELEDTELENVAGGWAFIDKIVDAVIDLVWEGLVEAPTGRDGFAPREGTGRSVASR